MPYFKGDAWTTISLGCFKRPNKPTVPRKTKSVFLSTLRLNFCSNLRTIKYSLVTKSRDHGGRFSL